MSLVGRKVRTISGAVAVIVNVNRDGLLLDLGNKLPLMLEPNLIFKSLIVDEDTKRMIIKAFPHRPCIQKVKRELEAASE